jgi:outer membrane immunogenic protein
MKKILLGTTMIAGLMAAGAAQAADLKAPVYKASPQAYTDWNGFYIGINGGGGWADTLQVDTNGTTTGRYHQSGALFGGTFGYNWQFSNWVLGVEGDFDWADINGSITTGVCTGARCFTNLRDFGTVRGRLGFLATPNWLLYGTGGFAWGDVKAGQDSCAGALQICGDKTRSGWTAGVGGEYMIAPRWSIKVEYLHFDFGRKFEYQPVIPVFVEERGNIVRAGLNWHFSGGRY